MLYLRLSQSNKLCCLYYVLTHKAFPIFFLLAAAATGFNPLGHFHKKKVPDVKVSGPREVEVSGPRDVEVSGPRAVEVSGARSIETEGHKDALKEALGLGGPVVASSVPSGCLSAYEIVKSNEGFTFLNNAIIATGLESVLADPALVATIFAPDDEAFTTLIDELEIDAQEVSLVFVFFCPSILIH